MTTQDVLEIYDQLAAQNIPIWIDGGWCVDALLGKQTREHADLDLAVDRKDESKLQETLSVIGYAQDPHPGTTTWNYAVKHDDSTIDIHVFEFNDAHDHIYGIEYPYDSLSGHGTIAGQTVNCISPNWMFKFKTAYSPSEKDLKDIKALANKFGFEIPPTHQR